MSFCYDITWCENKACPLRQKCGRNSALIDPGWKYPLSHTIFEPNKNGTCDSFFESETERNANGTGTEDAGR